ncbi:MAG TPA: HAD family hydrolase, partial [Myxococcales bacterium]|nr:HAD family hydrolase [Myxococcales bacterium]
MKPLAQLPRELAASLRGVIFDVDDTLTTRGRLTAEAYGALTALHDAGLSLIAVTGRPLGWTDA